MSWLELAVDIVKAKLANKNFVILPNNQKNFYINPCNALLKTVKLLKTVVMILIRSSERVQVDQIWLDFIDFGSLKIFATLNRLEGPQIDMQVDLKCYSQNIYFPLLFEGKCRDISFQNFPIVWRKKKNEIYYSGGVFYIFFPLLFHFYYSSCNKKDYIYIRRSNALMHFFGF